MMKRLKILPLLAGLSLMSSAGFVSAQATLPAKAGESMTREQVKMDRAEFVKSHRYDEANDMWTLKDGYEAPGEMKSRAQVKADRDMFLSKNRWDFATSSFVAIGGAPRDMSTLTREQVREETKQFVDRYRYDEQGEVWVEKTPRMKK